jgi:hypothetical protein
MPKTIQRRDVLGPARYEPMRDDFRKRIIAIKKQRRVLLADRVSVVFENKDTMLFQIEEMLRAERITDEAGIQAEIDVYGAMLPTASELSATLFIELPPDADAVKELGQFVGLDEHVALHVGDHVVPAWFEPGRQDEDRISAVQFIRFKLPAAARAALGESGTPLALVVDHPNYRARAELGEAMRQSLVKDFE